MSKSRSIVILGIDGMDPDVFRLLQKRGDMPVLGALAEAGNFRPLATSNPPQSPVSWTDIVSGCDSGGHGIFDFIHRNPKTYIPELSLFGIQHHKGGVKYISHVKLPSIFRRAIERGVPVTLLRWPLTFPAPDSLPSNSSRLLAGMGVPDMLGTLGRYTFYTADCAISEKDKHGRIVHITPKDGVVKTEIPGPRYSGWKGMKEATVAVTFERTATGLRVTLPDTTLDLEKEVWSPHVIISFSTGLMGRVSAVTRMVCVESEPFPSLFMLPMQIYPKDTTLPLSSPRAFGEELWDKVGPYLTLGMAEDTNGLKDGLISENIFLKLCEDVFAERERMLFTTLDSFNNGILACVFDTLDRIQHMFWQDKGISQLHNAEEPTNVVRDWYRRIDGLIGRVIKRVGPETPLLVLSDHGFTSLNTYVHLNSWLAQNGFMAFKNGFKHGEPFFSNVDWSKTRAYALGFNSIYVNIKGREGKGIVKPDEVGTLCLDLMHKLREWSEDGKSIIKQVYKGKDIYSKNHADNGPDLIVGYQKGYRASKQTVLGEAPSGRLIDNNIDQWSGDHCCDPSFVPGVLFEAHLHKANMKLPERVSVKDISLIIEKWINTNNWK